ncbi:MAG: nuclear transport factor 2 family protein [Sphingomonadaceae bacterium]
MTDLEARLRAVEDRQEIAALQARYTLAMDDHDLDRAAPLFARQGRFRSADGVMDAMGREAICEQYRGRFAALRFNFHVTHDHVIDLDPADPDRATGVVSSHAEVVREGAPMVVAMRYEDAYVREDGAWRFADRLLKFFYYLPVADYAAALPTRGRMRAYGDTLDADLPEGAPTFRPGR